MKLVWAGRLLGVVAILALTVVTTTADEGNVSARAKLSGFQENLPKLTDGTGTFEATIKGGMLSYKLTYSALSSDAFMSHIHFAQPSVNGGIVIWLCQTATNPAPVSVPTPPTCPATGGTVTGTVSTADVLASVDGHARRVEIEPTLKSFREKVTI